MPYGDHPYGILWFGEGEDNEPGQPDITPPDLMRYLPDYYDSFREMTELQGTLSEELGVSAFDAADLQNQYFVSTATWGLAYWEQEFGVNTDPSMVNSWRREILTAKIRGHGTVTKQMLLDVAASFSGGEVDVIEYPAESRFVVQFIGILGIPPNMAGFVAMLDQIKPAHLAYSFLYTYTTWEMVSALTWQEAGEGTWGDLRTYQGE